MKFYFASRKYFSSFISHLSSQKGFTLIELVIYMGLLTVLIGVLSMIFASIIDVQLESEATASVDQDGRYIMAKLLYDFRANSPIVIELPASAGQSGASLRLNLNNDPTDTTYSIDASNNLLITNSYGTNVLNGYDSSVSNFNVTRIGSGGSNDTVRVNFTITSRTQRPSGPESRDFESTFSVQ